MKQYFKFNVSGQKELARVFEELPKSVGNQVLRNTIRKAVVPVQETAKAIVRKDDRELDSSIIISTKLSKRQRRIHGKQGDVVVHVGPSHPKGAHGHLVEFGTRPRFHKKTGRFVGVMPALPFMRPAWGATKDRVLTTMRETIWAEILKAARRLRKQAMAGKLSKSATRHFGG
jgi:HK97 gp10 family phage protein